MEIAGAYWVKLRMQRIRYVIDIDTYQRTLFQNKICINFIWEVALFGISCIQNASVHLEFNWL